MVDGLDLEASDAVLEYGPGTGSFTGHVANRLRPSAKLVAIELNPLLADAFRKRYPRVTLVQDSVANVEEICRRAGIQSVDRIVSGLPWASFSDAMQTEFLDAMMRVLKPGGHFVTFAYVHGLLLPPGKRFAALLPKYFSNISMSGVVWLNLPPAVVYRCRR